jgi:four helix bundle protein
MKDFRTLKVWKKSHALAIEIYSVTGGFPPNERFGLTGQLRRAAVSIPSNIAEGCGRDGDGDFRRFVDIALGSASEVEYQIELARDLKYLQQESWVQLNEQTTEIKRMLASLRKKLKSS